MSDKYERWARLEDALTDDGVAFHLVKPILEAAKDFAAVCVAEAREPLVKAWEQVVALVPHNDVWGDFLADDAEVEQRTKDGVHNANPIPFGNWGKGLHPDPCKRCRAAAALAAKDTERA
jgi:hypothetical protein